MIYWINRKIWQIKNVIKWLPIIWNQYDFDYRYAIDVFSFQLKKLSDYLNSNSTNTVSAKDNHKRLEIIINLMNKVYDEEYATEYLDKLYDLYGKNLFEWNFIPVKNTPGYSELKYNYELVETPEKIKEIKELKDKLFKESQLKQKRAHILLWKLIEHNLPKMWD